MESESEWNIPDSTGHYRIYDMRLTEGQFKQFYGSNVTRQAIHLESKRWTNREIPYTLVAIRPENKLLIEEAVNDFNGKLNGCLVIRYDLLKTHRDPFGTLSDLMFLNLKVFFQNCEFRPKTAKDKNFLQITGRRGEGCWSHVGMSGGKHRLQLAQNGCMIKR